MPTNNYIQHDPAHPFAPGMIIRRWRDVQPGVVDGELNLVQDPPAFKTARPNRSVWSGSAIRPLTQAEQDAIDAFDLATGAAIRKEALTDMLDDDETLFPHVVDGLVGKLHGELVKIRDAAGLPPNTISAKPALQAAVEDRIRNRIQNS